MTRDTKLYFEDIFKAIGEVEEFMGNISFDDFCKDTKVIRAVTMDFIVIGEAICPKQQFLPSAESASDMTS